MSSTVIPDFVFNSNNLIRFSSLDSLVDYAQTMLGKPMYGSQQTFTTWNDAFKRYFSDVAPIKHVNVNGSEYWEMPEIQTEGHWVAQGDYISVSSNTSHVATQNQSVGGGGVKSTPKIQTIVTDTTTGGATQGESARGLKNFGIPTQNQIANIVGGLCKTLGIANLAINAQNLGLWRKLCNSVFDAGMSEDVTLTDIKNFLFSTTETVVARDSNDKIITMVPKSIASKMYDFFKEHIEVAGEGDDVELYIPSLIFSLVVWGTAPAPYTDRYLKCLTNVAPNTGTVYFRYVKPSDTLLQKQANDFINYLIGSGFTVTDSVAESFIASMEGVLDHVFNMTSVRSMFTTIDNFKYIDLSFQLNRGTSAPPKTMPISLSELHVFVNIYDVDLHIDTSVPNRLAVETYFPTDSVAKYLKRGKTGEHENDYAYRPMLAHRDAPSGGYKHVSFSINYPSNVQSFDYVNVDTTQPNTVGRINGFVDNDTSSEIDAGGTSHVYYSNLSYIGSGTSYTFDEEISAGFVKRTWDSGDTHDVLPHDNTTIDGVYPLWVGTVQTLSQTDLDGNESQTDYIPTKLPHGQGNAERIVNEGGDGVQSNNYNQSINQGGEIDNDVDINDMNEEINRTVQRYDNSDYTPEHAPDPIPQNYPNPQYPNNPPTEPSGDSGDTPIPTTMTGVTASGMCSVYNPTKQELIDFSGWLWSPNFLENFLKIFQNPMDAIIGLHIMYATPSTTTPSNIICGYLDSGVSAKVVDHQFTEIDCGTVLIPEYYGNAVDYEPYTQIHCYLPFIGIVGLKPNDVIGKQLNIKYGVDALTGTCLAILTTRKGDSEITCYTFAGNCATQIPISGGSYAQMITGLAGFVASGIGAVATANPIMALGAGASLLNSHLDVGHSGSIGANAGAMGIRKPYIIITRKSAYEADGYGRFYGYPANKTVVLGTCKGYTKVKSIHVTVDRATDDEKLEIETLLKQGVVII